MKLFAVECAQLATDLCLIFGMVVGVAWLGDHASAASDGRFDALIGLTLGFLLFVGVICIFLFNSVFDALRDSLTR